MNGAGAVGTRLPRMAALACGLTFSFNVEHHFHHRNYQHHHLLWCQKCFVRGAQLFKIILNTILIKNIKTFMIVIIITTMVGRCFVQGEQVAKSFLNLSQMLRLTSASQILDNFPIIIILKTINALRAFENDNIAMLSFSSCAKCHLSLSSSPLWLSSLLTPLQWSICWV